MLDILGNVAATFSKHSRFWSRDPSWQPQAVQFGRGARVWGTDQRYYLDWVSALGAVILGQPYPTGGDTPAGRWADAIACQAWDGAGFALPHRLEREVADRLVTILAAHVPGWQNQPLGLRWGKTGSDACAMALRLARAVTGRKRALSIGYHGWFSEFVSATPPAWGVTQPQYIEAVPFGDVTRLAETFNHPVAVEPWLVVPVAAVIIEQPPQPFPDSYWSAVRRLCDEHGALLILDEVVTGLRYALGGAAERFGIRPDLICMGKALGNGMPISCIVGRREYWEWFSRNDPVFISSTSFGEAVSLAAANAVLDCWDQAAVDHLWEIGTALMAGLRSVGIEVTGYPPVSLCQFPTLAQRAFFVRGMAQCGVLMNRPNIPNLAHTLEDVRETVQAAADVMTAMLETDVEAEMATKLPAVLFSGR